MIFGPVFHFERIATARRPRYYVARFVFGIFLLIALWREYEVRQARWGYRLNSLHDMGRFAESTFLAFATAQGLALTCLIPALLAGMIAEAHQRKTLRDMLASGMSSSGIVLGKLGAQLLQVGVFIAAGLPIVSMIGLFGGLDVKNVLYVYGATASTSLFVAGLSTLVSVLVPRPREAILTAYGLIAVWLFGPLLVAPIAGYMGGPMAWVKPVNDNALMTNPFHIWQLMTNSAEITRYQHPGMMAWVATQTKSNDATVFAIIITQSILGLLFLVTAVAALRPLRSGAGRRLRRPIVLVAKSAPVRPEIGDDPMLWKERYTIAGGGLSWLSSQPMMLVLGTLLGCYLFDTSWPAFAQWAPPWGQTNAQMVLNGALRESSTLVYALWILGVASAGAAAISGEREQDTWTCLTTTLLTGPEIVRAKLVGALWGPRRLALALLVMWTVGLLAGAIHPIGGLALLLATAVFSWFAAALGLVLSLRARSTSRALIGTIVILLILNFAYLALVGPDSPAWLWAGSTPRVISASQLSGHDVAPLWSGSGDILRWQHNARDVVWLYADSLILYASAAALLTWTAIRSFDRVVDRPRSSSKPVTRLAKAELPAPS